MKHLTERELIEYQFALGSEVGIRKTAGHLGDCAQCREHLEKLKRKFASLDLLREEVCVSEDLISQVVEQAGSARGGMRAKVVPFRPSAWIGAAAAVLLVGVLLLAPNLLKDKTQYREVMKGPSEPVEKKELGYEAEIVPPADLHKTVAMKAEMRSRAAIKLAGTGISEIGEDTISEQAPFAPASAIELVTLPRRDKVQLTIYNSTFQRWHGYGGYGGGYGGYGGYGGGYGYGGYGGGYGYGGRGGDLDKAALKEIEKLNEAVRKEIEKRGLSGYPPYGPSGGIAAGDLTLVRERRNLTVKKGWNWLQFMWANTLIDPTSLSLEPLKQADKIDIQQLVFPARLRELGRWLIRSEVSGQVPFEITYFTSGLSWRAFYIGTLAKDEKMMQLQGYVRVTNKSGEDYENAQTRLIVGKVHILDQIANLAKRKYPYDMPGIRAEVSTLLGDINGNGLARIRGQYFLGYGGYGGGGYGGFGGAGMLRPKEIRKEGLSEYFLYTIEGTETIPNKWGKRLLSFDVEDIEVKSLYKYDEERWGPQTIRFVSFANDEEHNLGETPIPNGTVKIYSQADSQGHLSYVGGTSVKYIPVNEEVELNLGPARLVSVEPKLMDFKTDNYVFDKKNNIAGWDEIRSWKIKITNTRELPIEIEITRGFGTAYWTLQLDDGDITYEKHDATHARFKTNLEPRSKRPFGYTVRTYHGVREETPAEREKK